MSINLRLFAGKPFESEEFELYQTSTSVTLRLTERLRSDLHTREAYLQWVREERCLEKPLHYHQHEIDLLRFLCDNPNHLWTTS